MKRVIRSTVFLLAVVSFFPSVGFAQSWPHVRILDPSLKLKFDRGVQRSVTMRRLVDEIENAPVLVFASCAKQLPTQIGARLNLITSIDGLRYVRVEINCLFNERLQIALLAHELQHAVEIAHRVDILDVDSMQAYYEEFGFQTYYDGHHPSYETEAAIAVQQRVLTETAKGVSTY